MKFSIITPSFRNSEWLKLCIASVADQEGVTFEHIVQDSCSDDGTQDWLPRDQRVKAFIEKDSGMYDAVNRGFRRAKGEILAYINCDEQYLPGALKRVYEFFEVRPDVDVVFSDTIVTDSQGEYLCHRYALVPGKHQIWVRFPVLTCALFIRRRILDEKGLFFDTRWRDLGDIFWVMDFIRNGVRMEVLPEFTSVFADTGENMNLKPNAIRERELKWQMAPRWVRILKHYFAVQTRLRLLTRGSLRQKPFDYWIYTAKHPQQRVRFRAANPTSFWPGRPKGFSSVPA
jgi:glycosyltransferase involved in cell wall biosynthesis